MITLETALNEMKNGAPFQIKFCTWDRTRKTGGKIIEIKSAVESGIRNPAKQVIGVKDREVPNHPYPVNIRLIIEFNGKKIAY